MNIESIKRVCLGKLFNFAVSGNYKYSAGDVLKSGDNNLKIIDTTRITYSNGKSSKGYKIGCVTCGHIYSTSEANLCRGDGCPVCSNHRIIPGVNDLNTKRPDIIQMLKISNDGYEYGEFSNKAIWFICPNCKEDLGEHYIHNVTRFGLSCPYCGSGISFPNRFMENLLRQINESYESEVRFDWCIFPSFYDSQKKSYGIYDFVIDNKKIIIEMDGGLGHGHNPHPKSKYTKEELIYRDRMKDKLAIENEYTIIRIDCDYRNSNRFDFIKRNVINSVLSNFLTLDDVDWEDIYNKCFLHQKQC